MDGGRITDGKQITFLGFLISFLAYILGLRLPYCPSVYTAWRFGFLFSLRGSGLEWWLGTQLNVRVGYANR